MGGGGGGRDRERGMVRMRFNNGDKVEVKCDDVGFRGAWYEASVVRSMCKLRRYVVVYDSLMCDDDETKPLRETVVSVDMRPRAPPRAEPSQPYALFQAVEAYHNDGWWIGVVSKVHGEAGDKYTVCFPISREEIEFEPSDLRPHLNWINNEWIAPEQQQETKDAVFSSGMQVEVIHGKGNSLSAWFIATIVKLVGKNNFMVEYESLKADDGEPLKEIVDSHYIRPCPPLVSGIKDFNLLDEVEAFFCDGWCAGFIMKVHAGSRYIVSSKHWEEEFEFSLPDIRIRYDWIDGKWIQVAKDKSIKSLKLGEIKTAVKRQQSYVRNFAPDSNASECASVTSDLVGKDTDLETRLEAKIPLQGEIGSCKKSRKGGTLKGIARLLDCLVSTGVSETPTQAEREFEVVTPALEERGKFDLASPLVNDQHHHKGPSTIRSENQLIGTNDSSNPSLKVINDESLTPTTFSEELSVQQTPGTNEQSIGMENHTDLEGVQSSGMNVTKRKRKVDVWKPRRCRRKVRQAVEIIKGTEKSKRGRLSLPSKFSHEPSVQQTPLGTNEHPTRKEKYTDSKGVPCLGMNATRRKRKDDVMDSHHTDGITEGTEKRKRGRLYLPGKFSHEQSVHQTRLAKNEEPTKAKHSDLEGVPYPGKNATRWKRKSDVWDLRRRHRNAITPGTEKRKRGRPPNPKTVETKSLIKRNASVDDALNVNCANGQLNIKEGSEPSNKSQSMSQVESDAGVDTSKKEEQVPKMSKMIVSRTRSEEVRNSDNQPIVTSTEESNEALQMPFGGHSRKDSINEIITAVLGDLSHDALETGGETLGESHSMPQLEVDSGGSASDKDQTVSKFDIQLNETAKEEHSQAISKSDIQLNEIAREEQDETQMALSGQVSNYIVIEETHERATVIDLMEPSRIHLPFVKKSPIWELIEAMEAFHVMPQQPHYSPLEKLHEELREGMAIGLMVTFASLVASIHKLQIHDTGAVFDDRLKTLVHLEKHGFNVQPLRARLHDLLRIKGNQGLAEEKRAALEEKISELQCEEHGLRKRLMELEEEIASIMAQKESSESKTVKLQIDLQASKQACVSAEQEFDAVLAAAW